MAITNVGKNRVYASIKDLPENQSIVDGDRIIVDTEEGTCLVDYSNFKIDLDHTTFGQEFSNMVDFTSSVQSFITEMETEFESIQSETATLNQKMTDMEDMMECVKLMMKLMMGMCDEKNEERIMELVTSTLKGKGLTMYTECTDAMQGKNFSFAIHNVYNGIIGA